MVALAFHVSLVPVLLIGTLAQLLAVCAVTRNMKYLLWAALILLPNLCYFLFSMPSPHPGPMDLTMAAVTKGGSLLVDALFFISATILGVVGPTQGQPKEA